MDLLPRPSTVAGMESDRPLAPARVVVRPRRRPRRTLDDLRPLEPRVRVAGDGSTPITGLALASDAVEPGDLFAALPGANRHGAEFAADAAGRGAAAILTDAEGARLAAGSRLAAVLADDPRGELGAIAARIHGTCDRESEHPMPTLFGVTGTNGKTSTVHLLDGILRQLGERSGLSSTAERRVRELRVVSGLTSPEAPELHALLARMREERVTGAALEVSAQALSRSRMDGVRLDVAGFTNLSHDHLDDYADMGEYLAAKARLFTPERADRGVVSLDSPAGPVLVRRATIPVTTVGSDPASDWIVTVVAEEPLRVRFTVRRRGSRRVVRSSASVIGRHMAGNAALAIAMLAESGRDLDAIADAIGGPAGIDAAIPGRIERVSGEGSPAVFVDFGHTADAFARTLDAVRRITPGRVIMVFGADGDRDPTKRPDMARVAALGSDALVITDHHPRFEDPASIRATLVGAAREARPDLELAEIGDPIAAIRAAVELAEPCDAILWAGPGHQDYREVRGRKLAYSAREEARRALADAGWPTRV